MKVYKIDLEIGGCIRFEYAHHMSEALESTANELARGMDEL